VSDGIFKLSRLCSHGARPFVGVTAAGYVINCTCLYVVSFITEAFASALAGEVFEKNLATQSAVDVGAGIEMDWAAVVDGAHLPIA